MGTDKVGDDREPRLGVRRTFCPLLSRQLGLIRWNSVHLNNEEKEKRKPGESKGVVTDTTCATGTRPYHWTSCPS